ncbi:DUF3037 domain-containing protein [Sphingomonas endolithica]|uniref:DUF3037 domain-containing protein n=1 Tax=Sphingomonas endolithica TaxID=2972485 RepID=UPI0021AEA7CD|nr:DUF3037 domain-containing protein [Sphingomonas sp. ZFBP2030]
MNSGQTYTYVLLRYRHDPLAGEIANVGVVMHCAGEGFLGAKTRRTIGRLSKMFPDIEKADLVSGLHAIERGISRVRDRDLPGLFAPSRDAAAFARAVLPDDDSSLIWGDMGSGITRDPATTMDKLYARFVAQYDEATRSGRDDAAVWQPVRERLVARNLADRLVPRTIVSPIDRVEFEHTWKNGAWHCYQPLSFDLASADGIREKAARWSGHMTGLSRAAEQIRPNFIVGAPSDPALNADYRRAIDLLRASALDPQVFDETEVDVMIDQIEDKIATHDAV